MQPLFFFTSQQWYIMQKRINLQLEPLFIKKIVYIISLAASCFILRSNRTAYLLVKISNSALPTNNRILLYFLKSALPANTVSGLAPAG